jgi:hypothetical protein
MITLQKLNAETSGGVRKDTHFYPHYFFINCLGEATIEYHRNLGNFTINNKNIIFVLPIINMQYTRF